MQIFLIFLCCLYVLLSVAPWTSDSDVGGPVSATSSQGDFVLDMHSFQFTFAVVALTALKLELALDISKRMTARCVAFTCSPNATRHRVYMPPLFGIGFIPSTPQFINLFRIGSAVFARRLSVDFRVLRPVSAVSYSPFCLFTIVANFHPLRDHRGLQKCRDGLDLLTAFASFLGYGFFAAFAPLRLPLVKTSAAAIHALVTCLIKEEKLGFGLRGSAHTAAFNGYAHGVNLLSRLSASGVLAHRPTSLFYPFCTQRSG